MSGGTGGRAVVAAGIGATCLGLVGIALRPPTTLPPLTFLSIVGFGAGLGISAVAGFNVIIAYIEATDETTPATHELPNPVTGTYVEGGLEEVEDFLRGGGSESEDVQSGPRETSPPVVEDEAEFIWGEDRNDDEEGT